MVRTEVLAGMRPREEAGTWLEVGVEVADLAGDLARRFMRSHPGVDTVDYLVAAAAQVLDAGLCTTNVRHYPMFPGLRPAYASS